MRTHRIMVLIGGLILIIGSQLPWISYSVLYGFEGPTYEALEIGWEGGGTITGGIGLILLLIGVFWQGRAGKIYSIPGAILAALTVLRVFGGFYQVIEINPEEGFFRAIDVGLYVTLLGGLLALAGAVSRNFTNQEKKNQRVPTIVIVSVVFVAVFLFGRVKQAPSALDPISSHTDVPNAQSDVIDTELAADDCLAKL